MKILITGASGFLGKHVVAEAIRKGHQVRAVIRPSTDEKSIIWHNHPSVELSRIDLRRKSGITDALKDIDGVIHLAAAKEGDFYTRFAGTVIGTENLLDAMVEVGVLRLVCISSFAVFDYNNIPKGSTIHEDSPQETNPLLREEYAQTKLIQEKLVYEFEETHKAQVTIIRPALIYGRNNLWSTLLGGRLTDNLWLRIGAHATMPLTYVENCAEAIILAVESKEAIGQTINVIDDNLPTQRTYVKKLKKRTNALPKMIPVNWTLMRSIAVLMWAYNQKFLKGQAKFPGIFYPGTLDTRFKHFRFSNARAKNILNWTPKYSLDTALDISCREVEFIDIPNSTLPLYPSPSQQLDLSNQEVKSNIPSLITSPIPQVSTNSNS
jgi:2-alkyl-3-oxoalkanoate reductase